MKTRSTAVLAALALAASAWGCSSHVATLSLLSTRQVDLRAPHDRLDRTSESDGRLWLLFLPLGGAPNGLDAAVRILEEKDADYLTNVEVREGGWSLLAISRGWVEVEADPWRKSVGANPSSNPSQPKPSNAEDY
jgi:hypothetical protein